MLISAKLHHVVLAQLPPLRREASSLILPLALCYDADNIGKCTPLIRSSEQLRCFHEITLPTLISVPHHRELPISKAGLHSSVLVRRLRAVSIPSAVISFHRYCRGKMSSGQDHWFFSCVLDVVTSQRGIGLLELLISPEYF